MRVQVNQRVTHEVVCFGPLLFGNEPLYLGEIGNTEICYKLIPLKRCGVSQCDIWLDGSQYCDEHERMLRKRVEEKAAESRNKPSSKRVEKALRKMLASLTAEEIELLTKKGQG